MEPKEQAESLVRRYMSLREYNLKYESCGWAGMNLHMAKECALIAVDELVYALTPYSSDYACGFGYWQQVKREIEKLWKK